MNKFLTLAFLVMLSTSAFAQSGRKEMNKEYGRQYKEIGKNQNLSGYEKAQKKRELSLQQKQDNLNYSNSHDHVYDRHSELADKSLEKKIHSITKNKKATVGVAVIFDGKDTLTVNNDMEYPAMSVFKFHQALALLDYMNNNLLSLESNLYLKKSDIKKDTYSPLAKEYPEGNFTIPIGDLLNYTVSKSDNNASDALYYYMSGTKMTDLYLRTLGSKNFSIQATEEEMNKDFNNQYINWTTPLEAARLLDIFINKDIFCKNYKDFLFQAMTESETGSDKLKALLPKKVLIGHKSGSSSRNLEGLKAADNDIGFVYLPNGKQYSIAVFIKDSKEDDKTNARIIADISQVVYNFYKNK